MSGVPLFTVPPGELLGVLHELFVFFEYSSARSARNGCSG